MKASCAGAAFIPGGSTAWAVGSSQAKVTLILHWNEKSWSKVASPNPCSAGSFLQGVSASSASDAWAVGAGVSGTTTKTVILHWNGSSWH